MSNTKSVEAKTALSLAREAVANAQDKLNKLQLDFESMKRDREAGLKALDYELTLCRNGNEREVVHNKIVHYKSETAALIKAWRGDINDCGAELIDRNCELRQIIHDVNMVEYDKFKSSIDLNALFKAFAFHRETFYSTTWDKFLSETFRSPLRDEMNQYDVMAL